MLDRIDYHILSALQADGRLSNVALAEMVGLSPSACLRRVQILETGDYIRGYAAILNEKALGRASNVIVAITLDRQSEDYLSRFEQAVAACPDVMECYLMAGEADYVLRVLAADAEDYERIHKGHLSRLPGVRRIHSSFALRSIVKRTGIQLAASG
ncbi:MAG: Lrp/AsnC family transcriptional regulator [Proteobacteria bacterium]|nr:Lrp/AsnC family transcriptional regulator [Pseudomonadota bacterium]